MRLDLLALVSACNRLGLALQPGRRRDELRVHGRTELLSPELTAALKAAKLPLLRWLRGEAPLADDGPPAGSPRESAGRAAGTAHAHLDYLAGRLEVRHPAARLAKRDPHRLTTLRELERRWEERLARVATTEDLEAFTDTLTAWVRGWEVTLERLSGIDAPREARTPAPPAPAREVAHG